jgi:hypothetical protein
MNAALEYAREVSDGPIRVQGGASIARYPIPKLPDIGFKWSYSSFGIKGQF